MNHLQVGQPSTAPLNRHKQPSHSSQSPEDQQDSMEPESMGSSGQQGLSNGSV